MRCVPSSEALGKASCTLDGMTFLGDGSCPELLDTSICDECASIIMQEVCIGLCFFNCKWANVSWMRGEHCSIREPLPEEEDNTLMMAVMIGAAAIGGLVTCIGLRLLCKMRARALEASRHEATREARKEAMRGSQDLKARTSSDERGRTLSGLDGRKSSNFGERASSATALSTENEQADKPEEDKRLLRPKMLSKKYDSSGKDDGKAEADSKASEEDEAADGEAEIEDDEADPPEEGEEHTEEAENEEADEKEDK